MTGTSKLKDNPLSGFQMNMSTCLTAEGWWGAGPIPNSYYTENVRNKVKPTLQLTFDDSSASFSIVTWFVANTLSEEGKEDKVTPRISGKLTIEVLGRIDAARSDILNEGTPVTWTPSMGFGNNSLSLDYKSGAHIAAEVKTCQIWSVLGAVLAYILI